MKRSVSKSKAGKFPCLGVRILTTLDALLDNLVIKQMLVEEIAVSAHMPHEIADFGPDV